MKLDAIDRRILAALQTDGRMTNNDLADLVGLSPSPCLRRVRALEAAGIIKGYAALLDPLLLGLGTSVFVRVWLTGQDDETVQRFNDSILDLPHVVECHMMAGDCDFLLRVVASDLEAYRRFPGREACSDCRRAEPEDRYSSSARQGYGSASAMMRKPRH
jgi:Lrp/AsnC family leucine-responsive transcriptional regulator